MRFLIDRCAGHRLAMALRQLGHDVVEATELGPDPGDRQLLELAHCDQRILVTIDTDFGQLVFQECLPHSGLLRLPDVPPADRIQRTVEVLSRHGEALAAGAILTVRGDRIRVSRPTPFSEETPS